MIKIVVNTHEDFLGINDAEFVESYKKRAIDILSAEWDIIEFENVESIASWRYEADECIEDNLGFWTQEAIERAYQTY